MAKRSGNFLSGDWTAKALDTGCWGGGGGLFPDGGEEGRVFSWKLAGGGEGGLGGVGATGWEERLVVQGKEDGSLTGAGLG